MKNNEEGNDPSETKKGNVAGRIKAFEKLSPEKRMTSMEKDLLKKIEDDSFMKRGSSIYSGEFNSFPTQQIKSNHTDAPNLALVPAPRSALISHPISAPITAPFLVPVSTPVSALITTPKSILNASNNNTYASIHSQPVADLPGKSTHSSHAPPKEAFANDHSLDNIPGYASNAPTYQISKSFANQSIHDDDGDDFFGMFSTKSGDENSVKVDRPQPTSEIETSLLDIDDMSAFSGSTAMSAHRSRQEKLNKKFSNPLAIGSSGSVSSSVKSSSQITSHLDNPLFCPKPARPRNMNDVNLLLAMKHSSTGKSPLPDWEMVTHSGKIKARLSYKQLVMRKWVDSFWIIYNRSRLIVFKSEDDFGEWMTNPYLNLRDRRKLAKFDVNFVRDLYRVNTKGYQVTCVKQKTYRYKMRYNLLHQFKLERWLDYGPVIAAAFGDTNLQNSQQLRVMILEMMKLSPMGRKFLGIKDTKNGSSSASVQSVGSSSTRGKRYNNEDFIMCPDVDVKKTSGDRMADAVSVYSMNDAASMGGRSTYSAKSVCY